MDPISERILPRFRTWLDYYISYEVATFELPNNFQLVLKRHYIGAFARPPYNQYFVLIKKEGLHKRVDAVVKAHLPSLSPTSISSGELCPFSRLHLSHFVSFLLAGFRNSATVKGQRDNLVRVDLQATRKKRSVE